MRIARFLHDTKGVAAVEAAILLPVFVFLVLVCVDFAFIFQARTQLAGALTIGSQYAVQSGASVEPSDAGAFGRRIGEAVAHNSGRIDGFTVKVTFNGSLDAVAFRGFYCPSGMTFRLAGSVPSDCGNGAMSGRFVTIEAEGRLVSLFGNNPVYGRSLELHDTVVVRVR